MTRSIVLLCVATVLVTPARTHTAPHRPGGTAAPTLALTVFPLPLSPKSMPQVDVRVQNATGSRLLMFSDFREETLKCRLMRNGRPQDRSLKIRVDRVNATIADIVALQPGAYYGEHLLMSELPFGFDTSRPGHYRLECELVATRDLGSVLQSLQRICHWPQQGAAQCASLLEQSQPTAGVGPIRASTEFDVRP